MKLTKSQEGLLNRVPIGQWIQVKSLNPRVNMNTIYALQTRGFMEIKFEEEGRFIRRIK